VFPDLYLESPVNYTVLNCRVKTACDRPVRHLQDVSKK